MGYWCLNCDLIGKTSEVRGGCLVGGMPSMASNCGSINCHLGAPFGYGIWHIGACIVMGYILFLTRSIVAMLWSVDHSLNPVLVWLVHSILILLGDSPTS